MRVNDLMFDVQKATKCIMSKFDLYSAMKNRTIAWNTFRCFLVAWMISGCVAGIPIPEHDSKAYLLKHNYPKDVIDALLEYKPLAPDMVEQLARVPDFSVRFMLARNSHLTFEERQILWRDKDQYVRRGLAENFLLSHEEMSMMIQKEPQVVWGNLAANPAAPQEILIQVFEKFKRQKARSYSYSGFAYNPNCPKGILDIMMDKSNKKNPFSDFDRTIARQVQERKEQYRQFKLNGQPFPRDGYIWGHADLWWRDDDNGE